MGSRGSLRWICEEQMKSWVNVYCWQMPPCQEPQHLRPLGMAKYFPQLRLRKLLWVGIVTVYASPHVYERLASMWENQQPQLPPRGCLQPETTTSRDLLPRLLTSPAVLCIINTLRFWAAAWLVLLQQRVHPHPTPFTPPSHPSPPPRPLCRGVCVSVPPALPCCPRRASRTNQWRMLQFTHLI